MICSIITPVGPGHKEIFDAICAPSVEQAKAWNMGPFDEVHHLMMDDTEGKHGRSARRNEAIRMAQANGSEWIFFLDADDVMTPNAFEGFGRVIEAEPDLDVVWGLICTFDEGEEPALREEQAETLSNRVEFLSVPPFCAVQIGGFYRTEAVARFGFDEAMDTGEDYTLYCQLWENYRCAKRPEIFFVNRRGMHSTGPRAALGVEWNNVTNALWAEQLKQVEVWASVDPEGDGQGPSRMRVLNPNDLIQMTHLQGHFFEADSLAKLKKLIKSPSPRILEVGANIGNHVVWYARYLGAERIYPVEPNPAALDILNQNIDANGLRPRIDTRGMGYGAGKAEGTFRTQTDNADNLGATKLVADEDGGIETRTLDSLMGEDKVDFIKIDAEGMELDVLEGAAALIARDKPVIWVEVLRENMLGFAQNWCKSAGYRIVDSTPYVHTIDYFAVPKE
jgi:FkbM family methyltransferase